MEDYSNSDEEYEYTYSDAEASDDEDNHSNNSDDDETGADAMSLEDVNFGNQESSNKKTKRAQVADGRRRNSDNNPNAAPVRSLVINNGGMDGNFIGKGKASKHKGIPFQYVFFCFFFWN